MRTSEYPMPMASHHPMAARSGHLRYLSRMSRQTFDQCSCSSGSWKLFLLLDRARRRLACMPSFSYSIVQPKIKACREEVYRLLEDGPERIGQGKITALSNCIGGAWRPTGCSPERLPIAPWHVAVAVAPPQPRDERPPLSPPSHITRRSIVNTRL